MVKILSSGEVVPDDDPRAQRQPTRSRQPGSRGENAPRQGFVQHNEQGPQQGQTVSIFDVANQRLLALGIPRWNIGQYTVEPIALVGFVFAGLMFGLPGLLFAAILFFVVKTSQTGGGFANIFGGGNTNRGQGSTGSNTQSGGYTLGR